MTHLPFLHHQVTSLRFGQCVSGGTVMYRGRRSVLGHAVLSILVDKGPTLGSGGVICGINTTTSITQLEGGVGVDVFWVLCGGIICRDGGIMCWFTRWHTSEISQVDILQKYHKYNIIITVVYYVCMYTSHIGLLIILLPVLYSIHCTENNSLVWINVKRDTTISLNYI